MTIGNIALTARDVVDVYQIMNGNLPGGTPAGTGTTVPNTTSTPAGSGTTAPGASSQPVPGAAPGGSSTQPPSPSSHGRKGRRP